MALIPATLFGAGIFSVDPASPLVAFPPPSESDLLAAGPTVVLPDVAMGLGPFDNLNALSTGKEQIITHVQFSVDRFSVGLPGTAVDTEALVFDAAGDTFSSSGSRQRGWSLGCPVLNIH